jgi:hypothetical protein
MKRRRADLKQYADIGIELHLDTEISVSATSRLGDDAGSHLLLNQEHAAIEQRAWRERSRENRRRNVVRQVPRRYRRPPLVQIGFEDVGRDYLQPRLRKSFPEPPGEALIEFDRYHPVGAFQQPFGERALAWADLDDEWGAPRAGCRRNAIEYGSADEEMLAESLTGHARVSL